MRPRSTRSAIRPALQSLMRTIVYPPPMSMKDAPEHVRRAMRAFERVHRMLEAKAAAERLVAKKTSPRRCRGVAAERSR